MIDCLSMQRFSTWWALVALGIVSAAWGHAPEVAAKVVEAQRGQSGWVIPNGKEAVIRRALEPKKARGWLLLQEALVDRDRVIVHFGPKRDGAPRLSVTLVHPTMAGKDAITLDHVAILSVPGPAPEADVAVLAKRLKAAGERLAVWQFIAAEPEEPVEARPAAEKPEAELQAQAQAATRTMETVRAAFAAKKTKSAATPKTAPVA